MANRASGCALAAACAVMLTLMPQATYAQAAYNPVFFAGLHWRNIGPMLGGRATAAVGVPGNRRLYYMGTAGGGVWKTENGGRTWQSISDRFFATGSIGDIAVYLRNPKIIYVGTGEAPVREQMTSYGDGVYKSSDGGRTWSHVGLENTRHISRVVIDPDNPDVVYVAAQGNAWAPSDDRGIYRSSDGGASWKRILFSSRTAGASDLVMDPRDPRTLYAAFWDMRRFPWMLRSGGPGSGIWKSTDGGDTWICLSSGLPAVMGKIRLAVSPADPSRVYAAVENARTGLFRSDDAGKSWREVNADGNLATRPWYFMGITADPRNASVVYFSAAALLRSNDGGATFRDIRTRHGDHHTLWINPTDPRNLIATDDGGASISFDGGASWSSEDNQPTGQFYGVQVDDRFPYRVYGGQQDRDAISVPSRLLPGVAPERDLGPGESGRIAFDPSKPRTVFVTNFLGVLHRRDVETGQSQDVSIWPGQHLGLSAAQMPYRFNWSAPVTLSPFDPGTLYHGANVLLRSTDEGATWVAISPDLTRNDKRHQGPDGLWWDDGSGGDVYDTIYVVAPSPHERGTVWVGTDDGWVQLTRDGGRTWRNLAPRSWGEGLVRSIEISPHNAGTAYVAFSRHRLGDDTPHFYKTTDYGRTWTDLAHGLPRTGPARVIREDPVRKGLLYAATEYRLWISFDGGARWQSFQQNLPHTPISDLEIHDDDLIAATEGRGFWILDDLTPVRQLTPMVTTRKVFLFRPSSAVRTSDVGPGEFDENAVLPSGANSPRGAVIQYNLSEAVLSPAALHLEILDPDGAVVRSFQATGSGTSARGKAAGKPVRPTRESLTGKRGLNQLVWDLRGTPVGHAPGPLVPAGQYRVRLTLGSTVVSQPLDVSLDPRLTDTPAAQRAREAFARRLLERAAEVDRFLAGVASIHEQAQELSGKHRDPQASLLQAAIQTLMSAAEGIQKNLAPYSPSAPPGPGDQTPMSVGLGIAYQMTFLEAMIDRSSGPLTQGQLQSAAELDRQWAREHSSAERLITRDLRTVNADLKKMGLTPIGAKIGAPPQETPMPRRQEARRARAAGREQSPAAARGT